MASVCSDPNPVNATADELRDSYTAVQDDIRRLEIAVREDAVQTVLIVEWIQMTQFVGSMH